MSKIEEALRLAKEERIEQFRDRSYRKAEFTTVPSGGKAERVKTPPALYNLRPSRSCELDDRVLARNRVINSNFPEVALTSYKMLRTRTIQRMRADDWRILAVTSPLDGAGRTLTAINLAITLASHGGQDVFLMDLDLRNPGIARYLGIPEAPHGLGDYLARKAPFSEVAVDVGIENLVVVPAFDSHANSSELIASSQMAELFAQIVSVYPNAILVVDLPAVLSADDALAISPIIDGFLLVVSEFETAREDVVKAIDVLRDSTVFGVVHNKASK